MLALLIGVSRWRFWLYLGGTYLVGYTAGAASLAAFRQPWFWVHLLFFLFPANLLLYGLNDLCDSDTDARNPKKGTKEVRLTASQRLVVRRAVLVVLIGGFVLALFQRRPGEVVTLVSFCALAAAYSVPPVRLKARPVVDSASNVLYALPGFLGYQHAGAQAVPAVAVLVAGLWTAAMHLFSAIPDIESDRASGLATTASVLGERGSLLVCSILWVAFTAAVVGAGVLRPWSLALIAYPLIALLLLICGPAAVGRVYWYFPAVNAGMGAGAFFLLARQL